jgi:hypothetical protein
MRYYSLNYQLNYSSPVKIIGIRIFQEVNKRWLVIFLEGITGKY